MDLSGLQDPPTLPSDLPKLPDTNTLPKLPSIDELNSRLTQSAVPRTQEPATPPPVFTTPEDPAKQTDNFGWLKNLPKSLFDLTKSVVYDLPKAVISSGVIYAKDPAQYGKDLNLALSKNSGLGGVLREGITDYYTNDFWHNFNEDPARFLSDLAAVASLGGGTIAKAGEFGKLATVAKVGEGIANASHYIDPLALVGKAAGRAASPILESLGFGKYTDAMNSTRATLAAQQMIEMNKELSGTIFGNLSKDENGQLLRLMRWGERGELAAAETGNDIVSKRFRIWKETVTGLGGDEELFKSLNVLDDKAAREANAIKMAEYSQNHYPELGLKKPITQAEALAMMDAGTHNPTFMSSYRMKSQANDLFEMMNKAQYRGGTWSRFEKANLGGKAPIEDVDTIMGRMISSKHDAILKIKTARAIEAMMSEAGELKFFAKGTHFEPPKGYAPLQSAFHEKYWNDFAHSSQATGDVLIRAMNSGESRESAMGAARVATESHPEILKWMASPGETYVPNHVAAWLNRELAPISKAGRIYDSALQHFKGLATVFNPKFWGSVIFGNATLGMLYGISPDYARIAYKYRDFLPPELRNITRAEYFLKGKGIYSRVQNRMGDFAQKLDNMFRLPMFAQEVANDSIARMKFAGGNFFLSQDQVINAVKYYGQAPERLLSTRLKIDQLKRELVGTIRESLAAKNELGPLGQDISRTAAREGPTKGAKGYDILGNKITPEAGPIENITKGKAVGGKAGPATGVEYDELGNVVSAPNKQTEHVYGEIDKREGLSSPQVKTSTGDEAKQIPVNELTGLPEAQYGEPGKGTVPSKPQNLELDELTGLRVQREPELYGKYQPGQPLSPKQQRLVELTDRYGNLEAAAKVAQEDTIHKLAEIGELQKRIPELVRDAQVADRAIEVGNRFYGSYLRLSPFERKSLRRLLPFYTFNKAMTMLAFKFPFLYPRRAFIGSHLAQAWNDLMSDENSYMPARLRDYIPVAAREDGNIVAISAGLMNPLSSAKVGEFSEMPVPNVFNPLKSNPVIALILKMNGAVPEWSGKPLSPGEFATRLDNGTVVQWTGKGFRTEVAQPSVFKSLAELFPQSQLIDRLFHQYAQSDRGWLFNPDPIIGPDGSPRYPRELLDTFLSNVIPTQTYSLDDVKTQEMQKMNAVMKSYIKDFRFATPVRQQQILEILNGWSIEKNRRWVQ